MCCPEGHSYSWARVGNTEAARGERERVERAGMKRPKSLLKNSQWKAASACLPAFRQREGVIKGFGRAGRGQPADQKERPRQQYDVIKEGQHDSSTSDEGGAQEF